MPLTQNQINIFQPTQGFNTSLKVAVIAKGDPKPTSSTHTVATGGADKGDVTITLAAAVGKVIRKGQAFIFTDSNDVMRLAILNADTAAIDTTITVLPLEQDIPAAAVAPYPAVIELATASGIERTNDIQAVTTFTHKGAKVKTPVTSDAKMSVPMLYHHLNAGMHCFDYAYAQKSPIHIFRTLDTPGAAWTAGRTDDGVAYVASATDEVGTDKEVTRTFAIEFSGIVNVTNPTPV